MRAPSVRSTEPFAAGRLAALALSGLVATSCSLRLPSGPDGGEEPPRDSDLEVEPDGEADACPAGCCSASDCGPGDWTCTVDHACLCAGVECEGACFGGGECCGPAECGDGDWLCDGSARCVCPGLACGSSCFADGECCEAADCPRAGETCEADNRCACPTAELVDCLYPEQDTYVDTWAEPYGFPAATTIKLASGSVVYQRGFVDFDLGAIPACARVERATLRLQAVSTWGNPGTVELRAVSSDWSAAELTWNDQPAFAGTASSSRSVDWGPNEWEVTALVQGWVDRPETEHGLVLELVTNDRGFDFAASEHADPAARPCLSVVLAPET